MTWKSTTALAVAVLLAGCHPPETGGASSATEMEYSGPVGPEGVSIGQDIREIDASVIQRGSADATIDNLMASAIAGEVARMSNARELNGYIDVGSGQSVPIYVLYNEDYTVETIALQMGPITNALYDETLASLAGRYPMTSADPLDEADFNAGRRNCLAVPSRNGDVLLVLTQWPQLAWDHYSRSNYPTGGTNTMIEVVYTAPDAENRITQAIRTNRCVPESAEALKL